MNYLLLTLGHGSSAIFVDCDNGNSQGVEVIGYEQERLSGIKSDSQFPIDAINEIRKHVACEKFKGCTALISHWFNLHEDDIKAGVIQPSKYFTPNDISWLFEIGVKEIKSMTFDFTHHDAHAYSAYAFYKYYANLATNSHAPLHVIVADGFGNNEEVLSVYETDSTATKPLQLLHRAYGYNQSLGLLYQYATSYVGMKENQDEYKFLGYEPMIYTVLDANSINKLYSLADSTSFNLFNEIMQNTKRIEANGTIINFEKLKSTKEHFYCIFDEVIKEISDSIEVTSDEARTIIAFFVQYIVEKVMKLIVREFGMQNVIVVGGCFYNVKLNNSILKNTDGYFCAMPLAGDQGAAVGLLEKEGIQFPFDTLAIGKRNFYNARKLVNNHKFRAHIHYCETNSTNELHFYADVIAEDISNGKMVNVVNGNMEFGPRALCNTSTLFLPTAENAKKNNRMNGRNEVMPFAPVCTVSNAKRLFGPELDRVIGSDRFMICTHEYDDKPYTNHYAGVMHQVPLMTKFTGRPQVVRPCTFMNGVLDRVQRATDYQCIVNTSFNVHGQPIVFNLSQILNNFEYQCNNCKANNEELPELYIINYHE